MLNRIELIGRIGSVRFQSVGVTPRVRVANFSVCTETATRNSKDEVVVEVAWFNCVLWEAFAGELDNLEKGLPVHVVGRVRQRSYTGADGDVRPVAEVVVKEYQITTPELALESQKA